MSIEIIPFIKVLAAFASSILILSLFFWIIIKLCEHFRIVERFADFTYPVVEKGVKLMEWEDAQILRFKNWINVQIH